MSPNHLYPGDVARFIDRHLEKYNSLNTCSLCQLWIGRLHSTNELGRLNISAHANRILLLPGRRRRRRCTHSNIARTSRHTAHDSTRHTSRPNHAGEFRQIIHRWRDLLGNLGWGHKLRRIHLDHLDFLNPWRWGCGRRWWGRWWRRGRRRCQESQQLMLRKGIKIDEWNQQQYYKRYGVTYTRNQETVKAGSLAVSCRFDHVIKHYISLSISTLAWWTQHTCVCADLTIGH